MLNWYNAARPTKQVAPAIKNSPGTNNVLFLNTLSIYSELKLAHKLAAPIITLPVLGVNFLLESLPIIYYKIEFEYNITALYPDNS